MFPYVQVAELEEGVVFRVLVSNGLSLEGQEEFTKLEQVKRP